MTIKWGDPIECNGVRPDWLRDGERLQWAHSLNASPRWSETLSDELNFATGKPHQISHIRLPADHPAYVALACGFHPWSGGESAPGDWDGEAVLLRDGSIARNVGSNWQRGYNGNPSLLAHLDIIGYRKRTTRFDEPHLARIEVEGSAPVDGVFIKRMTEAQARDWIMNHTYTESEAHILHALAQLGLVESRAERFTRETGHAITEAVEAALNWKGN